MKGRGFVLDPFAGSGTTALETVLNGNDAYNLEIDDIAKLITKVKTTQLDEDSIKEIEKSYKHIKKNLTKDIMGIRPGISNLEHWFSVEAIRDLSIIKRSIDEMNDDLIRDFFYVCFVSIIKKVSFADDASPKPYVSNKIKKTPPPVEKEFSSTYTRYLKMLREMLEVKDIGKSVFVDGDAINFSLNKKMDLAITSPPYINAFDYGRTMRLENIWMGCLTEDELRRKKKEYIGTEKISIEKEKKDVSILERSALLDGYYGQIISSDEKRALIVKRFFEDMEQNLIKVRGCLKPKGKYMIVIGNSVIRSTLIESWKVIEELSRNVGFETETFFDYEIKNPYIRIPRQGRGGIISRDHIIVLRRKG